MDGDDVRAALRMRTCPLCAGEFQGTANAVPKTARGISGAIWVFSGTAARSEGWFDYCCSSRCALHRAEQLGVMTPAQQDEWARRYNVEWARIYSDDDEKKDPLL